MITSYDDMRSWGTVVLYMLMAVSFVWGASKLHLAEGKVFLFAWAMMICTFIPASNVLVFVGTLIGERLLYLPSVGFCLLVGLAWSRIQRLPRVKTLATLVLLIWMAWQCTVTYERNLAWVNEEVLFQEAEKVCPDSAKVQEVRRSSPKTLFILTSKRGAESGHCG